ncbi:hypothetical protein [Rhizobium rhizogenes]|uniref:hypothetical protein n=1 Tax=Rhizobium rhizogenes TaxID=359 RepID=UPI0012971594|nr:hypothetical protein [Rhizobium rhizogenes]MQB35107.1 hypothetical protein [Rhizobium rhizogenes]
MLIKASSPEVAGLTAALDDKFGSSSQWTTQTFDAGKLVKAAAFDANIEKIRMSEGLNDIELSLRDIRRFD